MPDRAEKKRKWRLKEWGETNRERMGAGEVSEMMKENEEKVRYSDADKEIGTRQEFGIVVISSSLISAR